MEVCDKLRKSVLRKPYSPSKNRDKRVTFNGTVKLFIDPPDSTNRTDGPTENHQSDCVEISIIDKSSGEPISCKVEDCTENDFLVHKVIYDEASDNDDGTDLEEAEESSVLFDVRNEEESLKFVVHKVTEHEDDLIQQELALDSKDSNLHEVEVEDGLESKFSELSIENILTHDKIIAFIDQKSLSLASLLRKHVKLSEMDSLSVLQKPVEDGVGSSAASSPTKDSVLVLSPPLQELGLDKIVKAQTDNILGELDISPLNSIQESDSESDLSSEGTMIMMTTEEAQKNELHIQESFLKYQSLLLEKSLKFTVNGLGTDKQNQSAERSDGMFRDSEFQVSEEVPSNESKTKQTVPFIEHLNSASSLFKRTCDDSKPICSAANLEACDEPPPLGPKPEGGGWLDGLKKDRSYNDSPNNIISTHCASTNINSCTSINASPNSNCTKRKEFFNAIHPVSYFDKSVESVGIPSYEESIKKQPVSGPDSSYLNSPNYSTSTNYKSTNSIQNYTSTSSDSSTKRRESFNAIQPVRYFDKSLESVEIPKDVREWKIRTTEKISKENWCDQSHTVSSQEIDDLCCSSPQNIPVSTEDRHSPSSEELENFVHASTERVQRIRKRYLVKPKSKSGLTNSVRGIRPRFCTTAEILQMLEKKNQPPFIAFSSRNHVSWPCNEPLSDPKCEFPSKDQFSDMFSCHIVPGEFSLQSSFNSNDSLSSSCDHDSVSSCPSVFFQERGVPEGASPPRSLNNYSIESCPTEECPSNVVYFSMKV